MEVEDLDAKAKPRYVKILMWHQLRAPTGGRLVETLCGEMISIERTGLQYAARLPHGATICLRCNKHERN